MTAYPGYTCSAHFLERFNERSLPGSLDDLVMTMDAMRPCWWIAGQKRFRLHFRLGKRHRLLTLVWDDPQRVLVTAYWANSDFTPKDPADGNGLQAPAAE